MTDVNILVMTDYDGDTGYYEIPEQWVEWVVHGMSEDLPDDLREAFVEQNGGFDPEWDQISYLQVLALDDNYIGYNLNEVVAFADGREIVEHHGQWF